MTSTKGSDNRPMDEVSVLFENEDVIAVSKPEGLASIPERSHERPCVFDLVQSRVADKLFVVHRLDKGASGVMLFAKNAASHRCINDQFARHDVSKTYLALVHGALERKQGVIDKPIRAYGSGRMGVGSKGGARSTTSYEVVRPVGPCTLVRAYPRTGRRHQVRVHFYSLGHPIVGDRRYGDDEIQSRFPRMMLHALEIGFRLPTGEPATVECPVPESFSSVLDDIGRSGRAPRRGITGDWIFTGGSGITGRAATRDLAIRKERRADRQPTHTHRLGEDMGKGDRRTRRGKLFRKSYGKSRPRKKKTDKKTRRAG
jgi:tRNA pseudouridine32 synthase/23S rRNA pseudouridine746 synthase